jgi:hypothetical protein
MRKRKGRGNQPDEKDRLSKVLAVIKCLDSIFIPFNQDGDVSVLITLDS